MPRILMGSCHFSFLKRTSHDHGGLSQNRKGILPGHLSLRSLRGPQPFPRHPRFPASLAHQRRTGPFRSDIRGNAPGAPATTEFSLRHWSCLLRPRGLLFPWSTVSWASRLPATAFASVDSRSLSVSCPSRTPAMKSSPEGVDPGPSPTKPERPLSLAARDGAL